MSFIKIITEPAILIITGVFLFFILLVLRNYTKVSANLKSIHDFLLGLEKKELSYRFEELDNFMKEHSSVIWEDFQKALIYPEKILITGGKAANQDICLTVDPYYFFNEETLIFTQINHKFIQIIPTILTGMGPFFTFLKMAVAFSAVSFSAGMDTENSFNGLIASIQIAALCSVFAVGFSLFFMFIEKVLYNRMCKKYVLGIQKELIRIFDVVTSEKFLIDLVSESKLQNIKNEQLIKELPKNLSDAISEGMTKTTVPYMENILYSLNKLNETIAKNNGGGDIVDKLF